MQQDQLNSPSGFTWGTRGAGRPRKQQVAKPAESLEQDRAHVPPDHIASFTTEAVV